MKSVALSRVCEVTAGQAAPQDPAAFGATGKPFIRAGSLESLVQSGREEDCELIPDEVAKELRLRLFPKDTILFAKSGMSATLGRIYRLKNPAYVVSHLAAVIPGPGIDPAYLQRWFERNPPSRLIPNEAYPSIRTSEIGALKIELPKPDEQKRIAAILDKADAIRRKRQQAIQLADEFLRSVFLDLFGDPRTNPKGLDQEPLGNLIKLRSGDFLSAAQMNTTGSHLVYGGNGVSGRHDQYMFENPQIVIGRVGVYCGAIHVTEPESWVTDNALYVAEMSDKLNRKYLEWALRLANLNQYASQAAQPLLSGGRIYPIEILVPGKGDQEHFESVSEKFMTTQSKLNDLMKDSEALFNSASQRAFRGEL